jgi:hypothetical protein
MYKVVRIDTDCLFAKGRMFNLALAQFIKQKARKKLIGQVRICELVNGITNSNLIHGHFNYCHDKLPKKLNRSESLAVTSNESSDFLDPSDHFYERVYVARPVSNVNRPFDLKLLVNRGIRLSRRYCQIQCS